MYMHRLVGAALLFACGWLAAGCQTGGHACLPDGSSRFVASAPGVVTDVSSGLLWSQNANLAGLKTADGLTWDQAKAFVDELNAGKRPNMGYTDWRLPSACELTHLLGGFWRPPSLATRFLRVGHAYGFMREDEKTGAVRAGTAPFKEYEEEPFWTGDVCDPANVWVVDYRGNAFRNSRLARNWVWPVRSSTIRPSSPLPHAGAARK